MKRAQRIRARQKHDDSFESVARRLECDPDLKKFDVKLGKIAKATHARLPQRSAAVSGKDLQPKLGKIARAKKQPT